MACTHGPQSSSSERYNVLNFYIFCNTLTWASSSERVNKRTARWCVLAGEACRRVNLGGAARAQSCELTASGYKMDAKSLAIVHIHSSTHDGANIP